METMKTLTLGDVIYEITDENARNNIKTLQNSIQKINNSTTGSVGQVISIGSVDNSGKPSSYKGLYRGFMCSARGSADDMILTGDGKFDIIQLDSWIGKNNNMMSFSSGGIKCPFSGIIKIWGSVELNTVNNDERAGTYVFKNEEELAGSIGFGNLSSNVFTVTSVSAGDVIYLKARTSSTRPGRKAYPKSKSTNLYIEYC